MIVLGSAFKYIQQNLHDEPFKINQKISARFISTGIYSPSTRLKINVQHKNLILPATFGVD
jgi:hypothetical protein